MTSNTRHRNGWRTAVAVGAVGAVLATGAPAASGAPAPPQLSFVAATKSVTLHRWVDEEGNGSVYLDLGAHLVAGNQPFEVHIKRKSYKEPFVAYQVVRSKGKKKLVKLPAGLVKDRTGFKKFTHVNVTDTKGRQVASYDFDFCPSGGEYNTVRARPTAPATNPYPYGCPGDSNPFVLGSVWGLQAGWSTSALGYAEVDLAVGKYKATVSVSKRYAKAFKIPAKQRSVPLDVTVLPAEQGDVSARRSRALRAPVADRHEHSIEGLPGADLTPFAPHLRPAARRPAAVAPKAAPKGPRPDLRALPAWNISIGDRPTTDEDAKPDGRTYVRFAGTVWNAGNSQLMVDGFRRTGTELMDAYQYFFDAKGKQVGSSKVGTMEWDKRPGHLHWHFTDFAQYRLLKEDKKLAVRSSKEAFCLANTDAVDYTVPGANWRPYNTDLRTACGRNTSVAARQVLDAGSGDTYDPGTPGQAFDVTDLPNGTYYIEVLANPAKKLVESNLKNNSSLRKIILSGSKNKRKITVPPHQGIKG